MFTTSTRQTNQMLYINKACFFGILSKLRQDASQQAQIPRKRAWDT